jgi:flagellar motor switch/type III secretory pathway protein FliN
MEITGATARVWIRNSVEDRNGLVRSLLGEAHLPVEGANDPWSRAALAQAVEERGHCLARALVGEVVATTDRAPDGEVFDFASGAVQITCEALGLHVVANSGVLQHIPPRPRSVASRPAPKPLQEAAHSAPLTLTVVAGSVELDLVRLLDLQVGDVIRLPTRLTDRMPVMLDGQPVAQGSLGRCGEHKAVQLVSL